MVEFSEFADLPVVDGHVHFGNFGAGGIRLTIDELVNLGEFMVKVIRKGRLSQMLCRMSNGTVIFVCSMS